jgi:hypothetical protein
MNFLTKRCPLSCRKNCSLCAEIDALAKSSGFFSSTKGYTIYTPNFFCNSSDPFDTSAQTSIHELQHKHCDKWNDDIISELDSKEIVITTIYSYTPHAGEYIQRKTLPDGLATKNLDLKYFGFISSDKKPDIIGLAYLAHKNIYERY